MNYGRQALRAPAMDWIERAAVGASLLCLIHCAGLPLLLAMLPALSRLIALPESVHLWVLGFAVPISGLALPAGRRSHGQGFPLLLGSIGLALIAFGALLFLGGPVETPLTVAGSLCLASAHVRNWQLRHRRHDHG